LPSGWDGALLLRGRGMSVRKQAQTYGVSIRSIVASKEFARGVEEVRNGLPFNPDNDEWNYERGRCFGFIAPLAMPLRIGGKFESESPQARRSRVHAEAFDMTKKAKTKKQRTELDRIATQLRTMLRRDTTSIIEKGKLLLRSRELLADEHGQWMPWLAENFDMSYRSAINYCNAAEYVARKSKSATVANFANVAPAVLYRLAEGGYTEQEEAEILAQAKAGTRIDQDRAWAICQALTPIDADDDDVDDDADDGDDQEPELVAAEPPDIAAILDGPPPKVPEGSTENLASPDFALRDFDQAISALKRLMTKPSAQFAQTSHSVDDLENVEGFIRAVTEARKR
jgi:hypothetical protein